MEEFKYLGTTLTNQNSIPEEIKSRLRSGYACCHSVQTLLSSRLPSKNLKIKIYRTTILPVVLYECETTGKIVVLYILIFKFLDSNLEDKRFCTE